VARTAQHAYDPKRRTRRHHYQEGPGFLFVATQGGRPPQALPDASLKRVRERMRAVRLAKESGALEACRQMGCSRPSLYRWIAAYDAKGISGLQEASRRPHRLRPCVPAWVERVLLTVRLLTYWNSKRIAAELERRQIYRVGHDYIDRLLAANACARGSVTRSAVLATNGVAPTSSGTSTSRVRSSSTWPGMVATSRPGSLAWWMTTLDSSLVCEFTPTCRPHRCCAGWRNASSSGGSHSS
jgi:transposase